MNFFFFVALNGIQLGCYSIMAQFFAFEFRCDQRCEYICIFSVIVSTIKRFRVHVNATLISFLQPKTNFNVKHFVFLYELIEFLVLVYEVGSLLIILEYTHFFLPILQIVHTKKSCVQNEAITNHFCSACAGKKNVTIKRQKVVCF